MAAFRSTRLHGMTLAAAVRRRRSGLQPEYRELVERMPLALYVSSLKRRSDALYVSPGIVELLGYSLAEWREEPDLFERAVHPGDAERVLELVAQAKQSGLPYQAEYRMLRRDGAVVWVEDKAVTVADGRGRPCYWQGFLVDIGTRKDAEHRYQALVEQLPLITYIDSPDAIDENVSFISPQVETILGYSADEWHARSGFFLEHVHPDDRERVRRGQERARETGEPLVHEYRFLARDRRVVWLEDMLTVVVDDEGRPWYTQGFALDITARKRAESEREQLLRRAQRQNERLRDLSRTKDEFIALISHELRTPLTSIRGYLELVADPEAVDETDRASYLQVIDRNAERLQRLVEDLLLAAQAEADALQLERVEIDLARLALDCTEAAAPAAAARGISLECRILTTPKVVADPGRMAQVIDNLLSNAIKFTPSGGEIHVRVSAAGTTAVLEVADSGMGIPDGEQTELFNRFFRTERAQREAIAGIGLGLSIARSLVEAHGGRITFTSSESTGTTFAVRLPLAAAAGVRVGGAA